MGTSYLLNVDLSSFIVAFIITFSLALTTVMFILECVHLKRLIKVIDLILGVSERMKFYDREILEIINIIPLRLIKSAEGNFAKRFHGMIDFLNFRDIGLLIDDNDKKIKSEKKRTYFTYIIQSNVSKFSTEKLCSMLSDLIIFNAKDVVNNYKIFESDEKLKNLILKFVSNMTQSERRKFLQLCDEYCGKVETNEISQSLLNADLIKIHAPYSLEFKH